MNGRWLLFSLLMLLFLFVQKANSQTIVGSVTDAQTNEPLPFVNVYISNTTKGTQTDAKGAFTLKLQTPGYSKIVASMIGYKTFEQEFVLRPDEVRRLAIHLQTDTKFLNEVKVSGKRDKQWKRLFKDFEREFLGRTKNARNCKILNPFEIDVKRKRLILTASATPAIEIENKALGYGLSYQLEHFQSTGSAFEFSGKILYKLLPAADENETQLWENNRNQTYRGSLRHFLASVVNKKSQKEGFRVYLEQDSSAKITRNRYFANNRLLEINPDTLAKFDAILQRVALPNHRYEIHYLNRRDPQNWYYDLDREITWLGIKGASFAFSYNGILENSRQIETIGSMSKRRVADFLPDDYQPTDAPPNTHLENTGLIPNFQKQEKILLNLDQNSYAAGDTVHYELNVIDATTHNPVQQTLVYLTVWSQNYLVAQQKLWVEQGDFKGQWIIPDSLKTGTYQFIAHNNWSRNFDAHFWARKNVQVIGTPADKIPADEEIQIQFFPESGHSIAGLSNRVGVASFTKSGYPVSIRGWVVTPNNDTLATIKSDEEGYGSFYLTPPSVEQVLKVVLSNGSVQSFPQAIAKGYIMQTEVLKDTANILLKIINNLLPTEWKPMRLLVHLRGQILYEAVVTPKRNLTIARIPREDLEGTGVMQIALLDALNHPIATTAFYQPPPADEESKPPFDSTLFDSEMYACYFPTDFLKDEGNHLKYTDLLLLTHKIRPYGLESKPLFEYESGTKITGKITQANGKLIANATVIGFLNTDSTQLNFEVRSDESGHFSSPTLQFFGKTDVVIQIQSDRVKAAEVRLDTLPSFIPQRLWMPTFPLSDAQKQILLARFEKNIKEHNRQKAVNKPIAHDFRRNYPSASITIKVEDVSEKMLSFVRILEAGIEGISIKSDGAYLAGNKLGLLVDGLPTNWESLRSLHGYEMEAIDLLKGKSVLDATATINVLLRPESNFLSDQNIRRFSILGLLKSALH